MLRHAPLNSPTRHPRATPALLLALLVTAPALPAAVHLASPFTDHMVLQRDLPVSVWGTADAGEKVTVAFAGQSIDTTADPAGHWRVDLSPLTTSAESRTFTVTGSATPAPIALADVLVGEVWLASGQSNMVFTLSSKTYPWSGVENQDAEVAAADHPLVRMFTAGEQKAYSPQATVPGQWEVCSPDTAGAFSAIAYYFARDLQQQLKVPVGIVTAAYGASCAQAWVRRDAITDPQLHAVLDRFDEIVRQHVPPTEAEIKDWQAAVDLAKAEHKRAPRRPGADPVQDQHNPTVLYNGMLAPLVPYTLRGVIWYQGESITSPRELFPDWNALLIRDWRSLWGRRLPFYFCQLAALDNSSNSPEVRAWQAQALKLPDTGMVVTIDVGDRHNVHPKRKAPVGARLARLALARTYGHTTMADSGPVLDDVDPGPDKASLRLRFTSLFGGLVAKGDTPLQEFELAGEDGQYQPAAAQVDGDTIVVRSSLVPKPMRVRYAWKNYPENPNLFNAAGLPAAPFEGSSD